MKTTRFASSNPEKILEVRQILSGYPIKIIPVRISLDEIRSEDQKIIAIEKAKSAFSRIREPVMVEDTGVYFEAYRNFPGPFPSYLFKSLGYGGLLRLLKGKNRRAYFKTIVAYFDGKRIRTFEGICRGRITTKPDLLRFRNPILPYEAIFEPGPSKVRFCRMGKAEKNKISHRARAVRKFAAWYLRK